MREERGEGAIVGVFGGVVLEDGGEEARDARRGRVLQDHAAVSLAAVGEVREGGEVRARARGPVRERSARTRGPASRVALVVDRS